MPNNYQNKYFRLNDHCLFIKMDCPGEAKTVAALMKITPGQPPARFIPENESTTMLLDLLVRDKHEEGISYEDLKTHLLNQYALTTDPHDTSENNVDVVLTDFLEMMEDLDTLKVIDYSGKQYKRVRDDRYPNQRNRRKSSEHAVASVQGGNTCFSCGYVVSRYRP